jgi:hypothetical protein
MCLGLGTWCLTIFSLPLTAAAALSLLAKEWVGVVDPDRQSFVGITQTELALLSLHMVSFSATNARSTWLWVDANHNGISEAEELHTMAELGVDRIQLAYHEEYKVDEYGNVFRYRSRLWDQYHPSKDRSAWDVFLKMTPQ